ncbi:hypothetical protein L1987_33074 [Smallanthus sonchifolius]|uniref:Uncharacterized protein n=1 Tax=Smallanthus sonchifolius TaxID=185202 RepID=A0ACB9HQQ8_9ASTR|nr:hypothetical protein L1987_33074 [Smallanthus sonchifolius]
MLKRSALVSESLLDQKSQNRRSCDHQITLFSSLSVSSNQLARVITFNFWIIHQDQVPGCISDVFHHRFLMRVS